MNVKTYTIHGLECDDGAPLPPQDFVSKRDYDALAAELAEHHRAKNRDIAVALHGRVGELCSKSAKDSKHE